VQLLLSKAAQIVIHMETDLHLPGRPRDIQRVLTEHYRCDPGSTASLRPRRVDRAASQWLGIGSGDGGLSLHHWRAGGYRQRQQR
jgi:hypothetical protein